MKLLSSTDLAIAQAINTDSLRVVERTGRFGQYWSIEDAFGVIEVALSADEANLRVGTIKGVLA